MVTRTLVAWCLDWPIVAADIAPDEPGAVFHANRVVASSEIARQVGVIRGLRRREAQYRCPELLISERDVAAEARRFEPIVSELDAFAPRVEILQPGTALFATPGPSKYFGGDDKLARLVQQALNAAIGHRTQVSVGIADGVFAARLAARTRSAAPLVVAEGESATFLAPLPITLLDQPELTSVLWRLGVQTLGDFALLPAADVIGRFGRSGLAAHALAQGSDERLLHATEPPDDLHAAMEFDPVIERIDQAAFAARQLAVSLHEHLEQRGSACSRVTIEAESEHGERFSRSWRHEGALSVAALTDRVRWQLDGWLNSSVSVRPTGGLARLTLTPDDVLPAGGRQMGFWGGETEADVRAGRAVARLETIVGVDNVRVAEWRGGREPQDSIELLPASAVDLAGRQMRFDIERPWPGKLPRPAPVALFEGRAVDVVDRHGCTVGVSSRGEVTAEPVLLRQAGDIREIVAWAGPWLIEERWWDAERKRRRARFQIVDDHGEAFLVYLERGTWWLAGSY